MEDYTSCTCTEHNQTLIRYFNRQEGIISKQIMIKIKIKYVVLCLIN